MRLPEQVEVFVFRFVSGRLEFLLCKRIPERGGFWQPLTGGVEDTDENRLEAAKREVFEEIGTRDLLDIFPIDYQFDFFVDAIQRDVTEYVFAAEIAPETPIILSHEHSDELFIDFEKGMKLLKYDSNKEAMKKAFQTISERYNISA